MRVFRDETSLAVSPGLWPSIRTALDASRWFVLLASPEAARSHWVGEEITHWVSSKGTDHLLVVVTAGTWVWDRGSGDLSLVSTAVSRALRGVFPAEPNYLDMTWARRDSGLTLRNARFRDQVATLAAAIRDVPKEDIEGEDVRQQRRTRRIVWAVIAALTVLVLLASILAVGANIQRLQAIHERNVATSGQLISDSQLLGDADPVISRLLTIEAWRLNPSPAARYAMLAAAALPGIAVLTGHTARVSSVAFSPDGKTVASGSNDGTIRLWDTATHQQIGRPLTVPAHAVNSVAFSPDGKVLASGSNDGTIRLWNVATQQQIGRPITSRADKILSVVFSHDGKAVASGSISGTIRLWNVATHQPIGRPLSRHFGPINAREFSAVNSVAFSPDGKTLAAGGDFGGTRLWDVATHRPIGGSLTPAFVAISSVAFSPSGKILATSYARSVVLWDVATHRVISKLHTSTRIDAVTFSSDGTTLATGNSDGTVRLWDPATGQQLGSTLTGSALPVNAVAFSPDGKLLATGNDDHTVRLWNVAASRPIGGRPSTFIPAAISLDGKILATYRFTHQVQLWDLATGRPIGRPLTVPGEAVTSVAFSTDGRILATSSFHNVQLWDVATHRQIGGLHGTFPPVAFSPDGKTLATGPRGGSVQLWDLATHRLIGSLPIPKFEPVEAVAFSPDGKILATYGLTNHVLLWDEATRRQIGSLTANAEPVEAVAFSPDGKSLATGNADDTARLWDVATRRQIGSPLTGYTRPVAAVTFSPDGKTLATRSGYGAIRLWDVTTGQEIGGPLTNQPGSAKPMELGPQNQVDFGPDNPLQFSPDGKTLATGNPPRLWNVSYLVNPMQYLCASAGRPLTRAEWAQYLPPSLSYQRVCA